MNKLYSYLITVSDPDLHLPVVLVRQDGLQTPHSFLELFLSVFVGLDGVVCTVQYPAKPAKGVPNLMEPIPVRQR
jgi:hypothetical protein